MGDTSIPGLRAQVLHVQHVLAVLMGRTPDQAPSNLRLADLRLPTDVPLSAPSELRQQRPAVLATEAAVHAASAQVGVATDNLFSHIPLTAAMADYSAALAHYQQNVLNAFQNVVDTLTALSQDALALQAASREAAAGQAFTDTEARYRLGAVSYPDALLRAC